MEWLDYVVLVVYFLVMAAIGVLSMLRIKKQEDYFMGGRKFGKLLQAFAAFGAGTGSSDPITTARMTFTSGLSGMWSIMSWLFVTPFYWITGVWYRRMRLLTLGDWFVERYESKAIGAAYTVFGLLFFMVYTAMLFSAIGKFAAPLMGDTIGWFGSPLAIEYVLVPIVALIVIVYGVLGGLTAAYWTDLIQGLCIILLSVLLIPFGLRALVTKFPESGAEGLMGGFQIMHERLPDAMFTIFGSSGASDFPVYRIVAVAVILLVGVVVMPHFIATGGGSAKTETNARVGLAAGNFAKRFCTIGWALTALIILALMADNPVLKEDPDKVWGMASLELFKPVGIGLCGLMLACLLAALMSSADCYMIVCSALVVRNIYAAYIDPDASEKRCLLLGRITGAVVIVGAVLISCLMMDVFKQLQLTWVVPMVFAAPFWVGMYWRRATAAAAWGTVGFTTFAFFIIPWLAPVILPGLYTQQAFAITNRTVVVRTIRPATPTDVDQRKADITLWTEQHEAARQRLAAAEKEATLIHSLPEKDDEVESELADARAALDNFRRQPELLQIGNRFTKTSTVGGKSVFWSDGVEPIDKDGNVLKNLKRQPVGASRRIDDHTVEVVMQYPEGTQLKGSGNFRLDFLLYDLSGMDLTTKSNAMLATLELPPKIIIPFVVMLLLSLVTKRNSKAGLDRFYVKMKTPVDPDRETDKQEMEKSYADPSRFDHRKLFPGTDLEVQKPTVADAVGFVTCFAICFLIISLAVGVAMIGS